MSTAHSRIGTDGRAVRSAVSHHLFFGLISSSRSLSLMADPAFSKSLLVLTPSPSPSTVLPRSVLRSAESLPARC